MSVVNCGGFVEFDLVVLVELFEVVGLVKVVVLVAVVMYG